MDFLPEDLFEDNSINMGPITNSDSGRSSWDSSPVCFSRDSNSPDQTFSSQHKSFLVQAFVQEKKFYLEQLSRNIKSIRELFLINYVEIDNSIEKITKDIMKVAQLRRLDLKMKLREIAMVKKLEWDRQLNICEDGLRWLGGIDEVFSHTTDLEYYYNKHFAKVVDFVKFCGIDLDLAECQTILKNLRKMGAISSKASRVLPKFIIGKPGDKPGEFCRPWGVCTDVTGRILVTDRCNNRVQVFNECGKFLLQFGKFGLGPGEFSRPAGIVVDKKCRIIVADKDNHRIQVFTYSGAFLFTFGKFGSKDGEFNYPWDVAVNSNCDIAVGDFKNFRIQLFDSRGNFIKKFEFSLQPGCRPKQLGCPRGMVFWLDDSLLVNDFNNHQIVILDKTFKNTKAFGREGSKPGEFFRLQGIACDTNGKVAVADSRNHRIQIFDKNQNLCMVFGTQGSGPGQFEIPQDICFHPNGNVIVVDFGNNRVQVF